MPRLSDPLRVARHAVQAGEFRNAVAELSRTPESVRESPEGFLLAAMAAWRLGQFDESRDLAVQGRAGFRALGDADGEMRAENVAAAGGFALGRLDEAEEGFGRALEFARRLGDDLMVARTSNNLGNVAFYLGNNDSAEAYYRRARAGFERIAFDHGVSEAWLNMGFVARDRGRMDRALTAADAALTAAERAGSRRVIAQAFSSRGEALAALGDNTLGRAQVELGLSLARQESDRLAEAEALRLLGNIERRMHHADQASALFRQALDIVTELRHLWAIAEIHRDVGTLCMERGQTREAAAAFSDAEWAFLQLGSLPRAEAMRTRAMKATG